MVWNNYDDSSWVSIQQLGCDYYVVGREVAPSTGTRHLQGYLYFKNARSVTALRKKLLGAHIEIANGDAESNRVYCTKEDPDFVEYGEMPAGGSASLEKAREAKAARNAILMMGNLTSLVTSGELSLSQVPLIHKARMILAAETEPYSHTDVRGLWLYGKPRTGKSRYANDTYPDAYRKGQNKWWDGYRGQEAVILDDLDSPTLGHHLKLWLDRYPVQAECKNGHVNLRHKVFVITSNYTPEELFDCPIMAEAIRERCKFMHFGALEQAGLKKKVKVSGDIEYVKPTKEQIDSALLNLLKATE